VTIATALVYLVAAVLFIVGLKFLSSPRGARRGNQVAAAGMVLAVVWTVVALRDSFTVAGIVICVLGVVIGSVAGTVGARRVKMTAMPQMVALFNGVGGGAAALVAVSDLLTLNGARPELQTCLPSAFAIIVGGISFAGSGVAFAKLQELMTGTPITYPGQQVVNGLLAAGILALAVALLAVTGSPADAGESEMRGHPGNTLAMTESNSLLIAWLPWAQLMSKPASADAPRMTSAYSAVV